MLYGYLIENKSLIKEASKAQKPKLSNDQINYIRKYLDKTYSDVLHKIYSQVIKKCPKELQDVSFESGTFLSQYYGYYDQFIISIDGFESPAYAHFTYTNNEQEDVKKMIAINNQYHKNLVYLYKELSSILKEKYKNLLSIKFMDEEGYGLSEYIKNLNYWTKQNAECPSNDIHIYAVVTNYQKLVPSQLDIDNAKQQKYLNAYKGFIEFLQNPSRIPSSIWSGTIYDICHIIGTSSEKLNSIVASRFKGGKKIVLKPSQFDNDPEWAAKALKDLGDLYLIEFEGDCDYLVYSPLKKHIYWINTEHCEVNKFFEEEFPYNSDEFEDILYENNKKVINDIKQLFNSYKPINELLGNNAIKESNIFTLIENKNLIREDASLNKVISKEDQARITKAIMSYKNEINEYCKTTDDKDFCLESGLRFEGIEFVKFFYNYESGLCLYVSYESYDFQRASTNVLKMIADKFSKDATVNKDFVLRPKDYATLSIIFKDESKSKLEENKKKDFATFTRIINFDLGFSDRGYNNATNKEFIANLVKNIKENEYLDNQTKGYLINEVKNRVQWVVQAKKYQEEKEARMTEEDKKLVQLYKELGKKLTEAGYPSGPKTWFFDECWGDEDSYGYIQYFYYDEGYSGTMGDYDNGLTLDDKESNEQFVKTLYKVANEFSRANNCKVDVDGYRGHGSIFIIPKGYTKESAIITLKEKESFITDKELMRKYSNIIVSKVKAIKGVKMAAIINDTLNVRFDPKADKFDIISDIKGILQDTKDEVEKKYPGRYFWYGTQEERSNVELGFPLSLTYKQETSTKEQDEDKVSKIKPYYQKLEKVLDSNGLKSSKRTWAVNYNRDLLDGWFIFSRDKKFTDKFYPILNNFCKENNIEWSSNDQDLFSILYLFFDLEDEEILFQ